MSIKNHVISLAAVAVAITLQGQPASAFTTCTTSNLPSSEVPCGVARGKANLIQSNTHVLYSIRSTNGDLVAGVPVRADGVTLVPEQADTGGGTCNYVRASTGLGLFKERDCHMVIASDAQRYFMEG